MLKSINQETRTYILGLLISIVVLFVLCAVIFLIVAAKHTDIILTQSPEITCTYFISIIDRILLFLILFSIIPLTVYQILSKNKTSSDCFFSIISGVLLLIMIVVLFGGEYHYFKSYKSGLLQSSQMFSKPTLETKLFDKLLN